MNLDRNTNRGGHGKYALVNMRKLIPALDIVDFIRSKKCITQPWSMEDIRDAEAFERLVERGIITLGNESPGDQFFVMKYKDQFTHEGLKAYAQAVRKAAEVRNSDSLHEYASQMFREVITAEAQGNRIPD